MKTNSKNKSSGGTSSEEWRFIKNAEAFLNELLLATRSTIQQDAVPVVRSLERKRESGGKEGSQGILLQSLNEPFIKRKHEKFARTLVPIRTGDYKIEVEKQGK